MDSTYNTLAIILKRDDWKENDRLITAYSKDKGKLRLIARGAKKIKSKTTGHLEPLIFSRLMVVRGKNDFEYIGTAVGEEFYINIREDEQKTFLALHALNLVEKMTREGEVGGQAEIFSLLKNFLDNLENNNVIPAKAGIHNLSAGDFKLDFRFRGNDNSIDVFSQKLAAILGFSQEDFEELSEIN